MSKRTPAIAFSFALIAGAALLGVLASGPTPADSSPPPTFDDAFWSHWGDGRAEVASYELTFPRYGAPRSGVAVVVFVTETFSNEARVKSDPGKHPKADEFQVMKLNLVQDFPTGIYDYNVMTSVFTGLSPIENRPVGSVAKVSFSSQEWCGHVYHQLVPQRKVIRSSLRSYFDGESDRDVTIKVVPDGVYEDALLSWARGLASPQLAPGKSSDVKVLRSLEVARMRHVPVVWEQAKLSRSNARATITVPAGSFEVETFTAAIAGEIPRTWTIQVEAAAPRRIVRWSTSEGKTAELVASERLQYWTMNDPGSVDALGKIGLTPRPKRTM